MHAWSRYAVSVAVVAFLVSLPAAAVLEDPAGDVEAKHYDQASTPMSGWDAMDILGLDVEEDPAGFTFSVTAGVLESGTKRHDYGNYFVRFSHGDQYYVVRFMQLNDNGAPWATLHLLDSTDQVLGPQIAPLDPSMADNTISAHVPRELLLAADGTPPERGATFEDIHVISNAHNTGLYLDFAGSSGGPALVGDVAPDGHTPGSGESLEIQFGGGTYEGPVRLAVEPAYRVSNGEATTYRFNTTVTNLLDEDRSFRFMTDGLPSNWELHVGGEELRVSGGSAATFPVFVTVPFFHEHGTVQSFDLHVHAVDDPSVKAQRQIGIHYHTIPQPAGHHDVLWFHSRLWSDAASYLNPVAGGTNGVLSMSTVEEDPGDAGASIRAFGTLGSTEQVHRLAVCLEPELLMGLDFDLERTGTFEATFTSVGPLPDGTLSGRLAWIAPGADPTWCTPFGYGDRTQTTLGTIQGEAAFGANEQRVVTADFVPMPEADRVPPARGADLVLFLELRGSAPGTGGATGIDLLPGGTLQLPLFEYHDDVPTFNATQESTDPVFVDDPDPKESPLPWGLGAFALAWIAARRRLA